MKTYFLAILLLVTLAVDAKPFDAYSLKPEDYSKIENKKEFVDQQGYVFRVENTDSVKGTYIQEVDNGKVKWKKHGVFYKYYEGNLSELVTYSYGKKHGLKETYNRKGVIRFRSHYRFNNEDGVSEQYNDKGEKVNEATYVNGLKQGKSYSYYNNKISFERNYSDGKLHGTVLQYNSKGRVVARTSYNRGKQVGKTEWL